MKIVGIMTVSILATLLFAYILQRLNFHGFYSGFAVGTFSGCITNALLQWNYTTERIPNLPLYDPKDMRIKFKRK